MIDPPIRILLVEDNAGDARLLRETLGEVSLTRFALSHVLRLSEAIQRLASESFDVILLDLSLPDNSGMETVRKTHEAASDVPIVVLTGLSDESFALKAVREGAQDYLVKGQISAAVLDRSIRYAIERHRAEQALRRSEKRFRALIENSSDAIALLDSQGRYLYAGPSSFRVLGFPSEQLEGCTLGEFVHPEDQPAVRTALAQLLEVRGASANLQFRSRSSSGAWRWLEVCLANLLDEPSVRAIVANYRDITDRINLESQLRQSQKMEAIGQLAAGVAHDFNNILTVIQGHIGLLLRKNPNSPWSNPLEQVIVATERASSLTRQLLLFSRKQVMQSRTVDLNAIISNMALMLHRLIGEDIYLLFLYAPDLPAIDADAGMIEQIVLNLLVNARDAMPRGGQLTLSTALEVFDERSAGRGQPDFRPGRYVCLSVSDTGCGMDPATLARIFEPFFTTKEVGKGTGLGLATVYGIVKQHQGWIDVASEAGKGSNFKVFFPASSQRAETREDEVGTAEVRRGHETILVVEDEPLLRELALEILQEFGYRVLEAATGREALKVWHQVQGNVDLLLTDLVMPEGMTGRELADRLLGDRPGLKVIYTSGYSVEVMGPEALGKKLNFLQKPYKPTTLVQAVRTVLDEPA